LQLVYSRALDIGDSFVESIFSPPGFELIDTKSFDIDDNRELWFAGKAVFIYYRLNMVNLSF
jgi:hypothetical protein